METLKYLGKSLFSNQSIIDGRKRSCVWAFLFFILSVFVPWIPVLSTGYKANNAALLTSSSNAEVDVGFKAVFETGYFKTISFKTEKNQYVLDYSGLDAFAQPDSWAAEYSGTNTKELSSGTYRDDAAHASGYVSSPTGISEQYYFDAITRPTGNQIDPSSSSSSSADSSYETVTNQVVLESYYFPTLSMTDDNAPLYRSNFVNSIIFAKDSAGVLGNYPHSFALYTKDSVYIALYAVKASKSNSALAAYSGSVNDGTLNTTITNGTNLYQYLSDNATLSVIDVFASFVSFLHMAASPYAVYTIWFNIMVLTAAIVASMLIASIILIVLFKRKTSIDRKTNYWQVLKMSMTLSFTPCLLAMAVGFLNFTYGITAAVGFILIRAIFMSSKICPPVVQDDKPLYQARN